MSDPSGWQSSWQRPQEGEWKQAPDGSWYKDTGSPPATQWGRPEVPSQPAPAASQRQPPPTFVTASRTVSGKAVAALVLGVGGLSFFPFVLSVFALVLGYQARAEIDRADGSTGGRGQATAGIVLGWIGVAILVLMLALVVLGLAVGGSDVTTEISPA